MLKAIAAVGLALTMALPNLAAKAENFLFPDFTARAQADDSLRECLSAVRRDFDAKQENAFRAYTQAVTEAKNAHKSAVKTAWDNREKTVKSGRVTIAVYDSSTRRENTKAERRVFEAAKSEAEITYENAKKAASDRWRTDFRTASQKWDVTQAENKRQNKEDRTDCLTMGQ